MTKYIITEGTYQEALAKLQAEGGQLFVGSLTECFIHVRGSIVTTIWHPQAKSRQEVYDLAKVMGFEPSLMTRGRLANIYLTHYLKLPFQNTKACNEYKLLGLGGEHWHYLHVTPDVTEPCVELDIVGAYMASLCFAESLLWTPDRGYLDDNGAMECLRRDIWNRPKWFRLTLIGKLAACQLTFLTKDASSKYIPVWKTQNKIKYGAAYNCSQRAILRLYKIMEKCHGILGDDLTRAHTDSLLVRMSCPRQKVDQVHDLLQTFGMKLRCKGMGYSHFWNIDLGFIGLKPVGTDKEVIEKCKENKVFMRRAELVAGYEDAWEKEYIELVRYRAEGRAQERFVDDLSDNI